MNRLPVLTREQVAELLPFAEVRRTGRATLLLSPMPPADPEVGPSPDDVDEQWVLARARSWAGLLVNYARRMQSAYEAERRRPFVKEVHDGRS